jgi:hypothetical protein
LDNFRYSDYSDEWIHEDNAVEVYTDEDKNDTDWRDKNDGTYYEHTDGELYDNDVTFPEEERGKDEEDEITDSLPKIGTKVKIKNKFYNILHYVKKDGIIKSVTLTEDGETPVLSIIIEKFKKLLKNE